MKRTNHNHRQINSPPRRGSTLIIVLALLSLLAFTGMVFYTFAAQERASAEYFSEAAKAEINEPDDPFPWAMEQLITGANNRQKASIVWSPTARHSILRNQVGADLAPHTGEGVRIIYHPTTGLPIVDQNFDGAADSAMSSNVTNMLNFVDGLATWADAGVTEGQLTDARDYLGTNAIPQPDVDYTYPDINNLFVAYKGWAIRDNGTAASPRFERVPVIIPSFFRPQYLKSSTTNGDPAIGSPNVPTDYNWYDDAAHPEYRFRSFRPHPNHIAGYDVGGAPVFRYLDVTRPADAALIALLPGTSGEFPFRPLEGTPLRFSNSADFGKLGIWTGHDPDTFELDSDNDGDGTREGIWMDFHYPIQETTDGRYYATLHSFTILDLDGLIDLNIHGNLYALNRFGAVDGSIVGGTNLLNNILVSQSNQGLGPHEISPLWALAPEDGKPPTPPTPPASPAEAAFSDWYGNLPSSAIEQANMELIWLLTGRMDNDGTDWTNVYEGRWGEGNALWFHKNGGGNRVHSLPRPGRSGDLATASNAVFSFGGRQGFDDNADRLEGIRSNVTGRLRGFHHPLDYAGRGDARNTADIRLPNLTQDLATSPERWVGYDGWSLTGEYTSSGYGAPLNDSKYILGRDGVWGTPDDLVTNAFRDALLDDPLEMIVDLDNALRPADQMFGIQDLVLGHLKNSTDRSTEGVSPRLDNLAPLAFTQDSPVSERFTTLSNSLRYFGIRQPYGGDGLPGEPQVDDDGDGTIDEPDEVMFNTNDSEDHTRPWEWTADTDGADNDGDGYGDGDGFPEFPPAFGVTPYSNADPFRPQVRRLLTTEAGEQRTLLGQLPLSVNHILDVNRNAQTPPDGTVRFLAYMQKAGLRFRQLTEHPDATETDSSSQTAAAAVTSIPQVGSTAGDTALQSFPPQTFAHREFWARRDRQKLARDIYVLLYTTGGAEIDGSGISVVNYTGDNSGRALYSNERLRQMAQFAVNLVDALDTDDVITRFEYDKNFGNGWDLDDDPYTDDGYPASSATADTGNGLYPEDSATERGVVYGVESQHLAFSEVLGVRSQDLMADNHNADETVYDDESGTRFFMHVELQNMQPFEVPLTRTEVGTTDEEQALWRLVRVDRDGASTDAQVNITTGTADGAMSFMEGNPNVTAGGRFTIGMATLDGDPGNIDPVGFGNADMYIDHDADSNFNLISPDVTAAAIVSGDTPNPMCNLDVIHSTHSSRWLMAGNSTQGGLFLNGVETLTGYQGNDDYNIGQAPASANGPFGAATSTKGFDLVLQRRLNPNLPRLPLAENPWIEVDRSRVLFRNLFDRSGASPVVQLDQTRSFERQEPLNTASAGFNGKEEDQTSTAPLDNRFNSIGSVNDRNRVFSSGTINPFDLWQAHFDRDFASTAELLNLPIVGPRLLTSSLDRMRYPGYIQCYDNHLGAGPAVTPDNIAGAAGMFLWPDFDPTTPLATENDNRWYRLLSFVEVPSRVNSMLGNYLNLNRLPGKLNPNMIRHREVYAGLIDDGNLASPPSFNTGTTFKLDDDIDGDGNVDGPFLASVANLANAASADGNDGTPGYPLTVTHPGEPTGTLPFPYRNQTNTYERDRWQEFINERDGLVNSYDPVAAATRQFWIPGTPNSRPFRSLGYRNGTADDNGLEDTLLRRLSLDKPANGAFNRAGEGTTYDVNAVGTPDATNRHWLEVGNRAFHIDPTTGDEYTATMVQKHQVLSKIINNVTTVSNCFIVYGTAAYFEAIPDLAGSGEFRVGGRMSISPDPADTSAGWERRAIFVIDRTELFNAYDPGSGSFDWERLVKYRIDLPSDGQ